MDPQLLFSLDSSVEMNILLRPHPTSEQEAAPPYPAWAPTTTRGTRGTRGRAFATPRSAPWTANFKDFTMLCPGPLRDSPRCGAEFRGSICGARGHVPGELLRGHVLNVTMLGLTKTPPLHTWGSPRGSRRSCDRFGSPDYTLEPCRVREFLRENLPIFDIFPMCFLLPRTLRASARVCACYFSSSRAPGALRLFWATRTKIRGIE